MYTIATLAPALRISTACLPFVIPPVANMTLDFWDGRLAVTGLPKANFEGVLELTGRFTVFSFGFRPKLP